MRVAPVNALCLLALSIPVLGAESVNDITGFAGASDSNCPSTVTVFNQDDCSYNASSPLASQGYIAVEWIGPLFNAGYYAPGDSPGPAIAGGVEPIPGDDKSPRPVSGTLSIDDAGTPANGSDDLISGSLNWGATVRNFGAGARGTAEESWTSLTLQFGPVAVSTGTPNGNGGYDYVIGSGGMPVPLVDAATGTNAWPAEAGADSDSALTGSYWAAPGNVGLAPIEANVSLGTTATFSAAGYTCIDTQDGIGGAQSACDAKGRLGDGVTSGARDFENVLLQVSTDDDGNVTSAKLIWVQQTDVVAPNNVPDSWVAGVITFTGTCNNCLVPGVATDDSFAVDQDSAGNVLAVGSNDLNFRNPATATISSQPSQGGQAVVAGSPGAPQSITISYTPAPGFAGTETFDYTVNDGTTSDTARVTVVVASLAANDDLATTALNTAVVITVGANDVGFLDPATLSISSAPGAGGTAVVQNSPGDPATLAVLFTPAAALGTSTYVETFQYTIDDGVRSQAATVTVTIQNAVPLAQGATRAVDQGEAVTIDVATLPGASLGDGPAVVSVTGAPTGGAAQVSATRITYTPGALFTGADTFQYTIEDRDGEVSSATVTVNVAPRVAVATNDFANTFRGESVEIDVTENDIPGTGALADHLVVITRQPGTGTVSVSGLVITYAATADSPANDNFEYALTDVDGDTSPPATVQVGIGPGFEPQPAPGVSALDPWSGGLLGAMAVWLEFRRRLRLSGRTLTNRGFAGSGPLR